MVAQLQPLMPRIKKMQMKIGEVLSSNRVKDILGDSTDLLKRHNKWIVEDILEGESEIYPAVRKTRVRKKVNITRIFLVPFDSDDEHIRIRMWFHD